MKQIQKYYLMPMALALLVALVLSAPGRALADPIGPGFDAFTTPDDTAFIDLTGFGLGIIDLMGNPIPGQTGGADTIVERLTGLGDGEIGTIEIELVALSLVSVGPVDIDFTSFAGGTDSMFNVFLTLDDTTPSLGEMEILTHDDTAGGGTFTSFFDVFFEITFVDLFSSFIFIQTGFEHIGEPAEPNTWIHTENDDFFPTGVTEHTGPHPATISAIPLPAALPLYGTGLAVMGVFGWYRKRKAA